jgi:hypothetical protein
MLGMDDKAVEKPIKNGVLGRRLSS